MMTMMTMKRMVASHKACICLTMAVLGAFVGIAAAKSVIGHCCCANSLKDKARKAIKTMEDTLDGCC